MIMFKKVKLQLINHLCRSGKKKTSEKILLRSFKNIQKTSKKSHKKILQLSVVNSLAMFRIISLKSKKKRGKKRKILEIPLFIYNDVKRISWTLKFIVISSKNQSTHQFYKKLKQEIMYCSKNKGNLINEKLENNKNILIKQKLFEYYRW